MAEDSTERLWKQRNDVKYQHYLEYDLGIPGIKWNLLIRLEEAADKKQFAPFDVARPHSVYNHDYIAGEHHIPDDVDDRSSQQFCIILRYGEACEGEACK